MKTLILALMGCASMLAASAQIPTGDETRRLTDHLEYRTEFEFTTSDGTTPLWLNANKHGLSSLKSNNGYVRMAVGRQVDNDSLRQWGVGYSVDLAVASGFTNTMVVQQAYVDVRWKHGLLTIGSKEQPMELKNNRLSTGSQTVGINARPVPQVRLSLPDYWVLPVFNGLLAVKGHVAYGRMTDDNWQHKFTNRETNYADNVLFHSKAGYLKIGREGKPFSVEMGLEMACQFGGMAHNTFEGFQDYPGDSSLKGFWNAFLPGGSEANEGDYGNKAGNQLGSWVVRLNYDKPTWGVSLYGDKFFEDHSGMFFLDYNGYGTGDEWMKWKDNKWFVYDFKDMLVGAELRLKNTPWLNNVVMEYLYSKYQSGPIYHDHTQAISDHVAGQDNYYNHFIYTCWQHWGQVMGNPLYRSPLYNADGTIEVKNNRMMALHLGLEGQPLPRLGYRLMATWQEGLGTYGDPYLKKQYNRSVMLEANYQLGHNWDVRVAGAFDHGQLLGNNSGVQVTVSHRGLFGK